MKTTFLDFEQSIAELESKIEELRFVQDESSVDISDEIKTLSEKSLQLTKEVYDNQRACIAKLWHESSRGLSQSDALDALS